MNILPMPQLDHSVEHNLTATSLVKPLYALISVYGDPAAEIGIDGAGRHNVYVRELGLSLAEQGCQVDMFTRLENPDQERIVEHVPGCRTIRLAAGPARFVPNDELFEYLPAFVDAWITFQSHSDRPYGVIHTNYWLSAWVGFQLRSRLGLPQVHTYHSLSTIQYTGVQSAIPLKQWQIEKACLKAADWLIATNPKEEADLRQLVSRRGRIKVIPCGINTEHFGSVGRDIARERLNLPASLPLILYVGCFDPCKGIETLLQACSHLEHPFFLHLVGGSRAEDSDRLEWERLQAMVQQLGLEHCTVFTGPIPRELLPLYYAAANVCVFPSHDEPFGLVAIEAMAAGTPVIASDVGGLSYNVVHGMTGWLVPPKSPEKLAEALRDALIRPSRWRTYGKNGQKWVRANFSRLAVATQVQQLYHSLTLCASQVKNTKPEPNNLRS